MTVNLMILTGTAYVANGRSVWAEMTAIAPYAQVPITDKVVRDAALLLEDVRLSNGQPIGAYPSDEEDQMSSLVTDFGPTLLDADKLTQIRELLEPHPDAIRLLDVVIARGTKIRFSGSDMGRGAHLCGSTSPADEIEINHCESRMENIFTELGLAKYGKGDDVPFAEFSAAVKDPKRTIDTDTARLARFVDYATKHGATAVYYA